MADHRAGVYQIVDWIGGRQYVGSAADFHPRWQFHWSQLRRGIHHSAYLQRVYDKYGEDNLSIEILEVIEIPNGWSDAEADGLIRGREQWWMDACQPVFNSHPAAGSSLGFKHSAETKEKLKQRRTRGPVPEEEKEALRQRMTGNTYCVGRVRSEASRARTSAALKGKPKSPEHIAKMIGHPVSEETRQKLRDAHLGMTASDETKAKMSESQTGRTHSEETKAKIALASTAHRHSDLTKAKLREINTGRVPSEETRRRMGEAGRNRKPPSDETRKNLRAAALLREEKKRLARQEAAEQKAREELDGTGSSINEEA
jgi:group I intron endonuclease